MRRACRSVGVGARDRVPATLRNQLSQRIPAAERVPSAAVFTLTRVQL